MDNAKTILLTGATGFLGTALVQELLATTSATLVCLVRPTSAEVMGADRGRIRTVTGDLSQPRLGLSDDAYEALCGEVDAVLHSGAAVNWVYSYAGLRSANVTGTAELLRLACFAGAPLHFVSSLSTCYSTSSDCSVDETFEALPGLRGLHLGYAQTKAVAEALVGEAGRRGLPVRIYRPALISGHSVTGAFNRDDIISTLVRGCVHMGTAPDLDWKLDAVPVDVVARSIVQLSGDPGPVFHVGHARPRHWREFVLWMRMYGYDVRLVSYHTWLRQLERETLLAEADSAAHPLRPLRSFFLNRPDGERGLTQPELYEERRRTHASCAHTNALLARAGVVCPSLNAALLDTYFGAFRASGDLPSPVAPDLALSVPTGVDEFDPALLSRVVGAAVRRVDLLSSGSDHSIISELTAWRSHRSAGLFRARLTMDEASEDVFIKVKAHDSDVMAVGTALANLIDPAVGVAYSRHIGRIGFTGSHTREIASYRQADSRVRRHIPRVLGTLSDDATATWMAVLEDVNGAALLDSVDTPDVWGEREITAAIDGLAALHAVWLGKEGELRQQPWIGHVPSAATVGEMTDLWLALADHAAPFFSGWTHPDIAQIHHRLAAEAGLWWAPLDRGPRTLIHHDFNPRNICLRTAAGGQMRLCAYDWELATIGAPQRDLAEFLCFVLTDVTDAPRWIEHHRLALERESGTALPAETWNTGFGSALCDVLINRLSIYAMVHRVRRQSFLPRVVHAWRTLHEQFAPRGVA